MDEIASPPLSTDITEGVCKYPNVSWTHGTAGFPRVTSQTSQFLAQQELLVPDNVPMRESLARQTLTSPGRETQAESPSSVKAFAVRESTRLSQIPVRSPAESLATLRNQYVIKTDPTGQATLDITYPKEEADAPPPEHPGNKEDKIEGEKTKEPPDPKELDIIARSFLSFRDHFKNVRNQHNTLGELCKEADFHLRQSKVAQTDLAKKFRVLTEHTQQVLQGTSPEGPVVPPDTSAEDKSSE